VKIIEKYSSIRLTNYTSCNSYTAFILLRRKPIYYSFSFCQWQSHSWSAVRYSFYKFFFLASKLCVKFFSRWGFLTTIIPFYIKDFMNLYRLINHVCHKCNTGNTCNTDNTCHKCNICNKNRYISKILLFAMILLIYCFMLSMIFISKTVEHVKIFTLA
jgi:hypothetical protein